MKLPFTASDTSVAVFVNGKMETLKSDQFNFEALLEHLKQPEHDAGVVANLVDQKTLLSRITAGSVTVIGETVYHAGMPLHSSLAGKLLEMLNAGYDVEPWALFLDNMMDNPSERSKECLYDFLEKFQVPFTLDGCFIAFKRVRKDYSDIYSGTFDNSPGAVVTIPREDVNDDPNVVCAAGLHVCASSYLGHFYSTDVGARVIAVKVNPRDVVAVPHDYNSAKMRTCGYTVLGDVEEGDKSIRDIEAESVYTGTGETPTPLDVTAIVEATTPETVKPEIGMRVVDWEGDTGEIISIMDHEYVVVRYDDESFGVIDGVFGPKIDADVGGDIVFKPVAGKEESDWVFIRNDLIISAADLLDNVSKWGQREYSRRTGVPRTTLQEWIKKAKA